MARNTNERISEAWREFESFRSLGEGFGALRELGKIMVLADGIQPDERGIWRRRVSNVQLEPDEIEYVMTRGGRCVRMGAALVACANELRDDEINLLLSTIIELQLVDRFLTLHSRHSLAAKIEGLQAEVRALRESPRLALRIQREESVIRKNTGLKLGYE